MNIESKIVHKPAFVVAGMRIATRAMAPEIPALWQRFAPRIDEVAAIAEPHVSYGIMANFEPASGTLDYMAAVSVTRADPLPERMEVLRLEAQDYAVFAASLRTLTEVFGFIVNTWPAHSGLEQVDAPYFERYGESFDPADPDSLVEIYIPIASPHGSRAAG